MKKVKGGMSRYFKSFHLRLTKTINKKEQGWLRMKQNETDWK